MKKLVLFISIACCLTGCAHHLTQQECQAINWYNEGVADGVVGKNPRDFSQNQQDCLKFKINIDTERYTN